MRPDKSDDGAAENDKRRQTGVANPTDDQARMKAGKQESRKDGVGRRARKRKHTASTEEQTEQDQSDRNESRQRRRRKVSWHVPCTRQKADMEHVRRTSAPGSCLGTGARCPDSGRAAIR